MNNNIDGKVIIITGASSGIGLATAKLLAAQGAVLSLAARRKEKLEQLVKEITGNGGKAKAFATDVTKRAEMDALISNTIQAYGKVDVIFNNAGIMPLSMMENLHYDEWEQMIDINIKGVLYGIGAVLPHFKAQRSGHIINTSSVVAYFVPPASAVYSATKYAVRALSDGLRQELSPYNIRCTNIAPGLTQSELTDSISDPGLQQMVTGLMDIAIPAESIAHAVAYAIGQPEAVDVNEIIIRPTAQAL